MFVPVTREDFIKIGRRFATVDIINEADRLLPLATADLAVLSTRGYTQAMLDQLLGWRKSLNALSAATSEVRGAKKGARESEAIAMKDGRLMLREGVAIATAALTRRPMPAGETPKTARERITELTSKLRTLGGRVDRDSAKLRTRLLGLKELLGSSDFAPIAGEEPEREKFMAELETALDALINHAEAKKSLRSVSMDKTVENNELDGRVYANMRLLAQVGRAAFEAKGDKVHAAMYSLRQLNHKGPAPSTEQSSPGSTPAKPGLRPTTPPPVRPTVADPAPVPTP